MTWAMFLKRSGSKLGFDNNTVSAIEVRHRKAASLATKPGDSSIDSHPMFDMASCAFCRLVVHFEELGFQAEIDALGSEITEVRLRDIRIYDDRADSEHRDDLACLLIFRKA